MREIGKVDVLVIDCWGLLIAGAGASSLQRYVQTIARISQDKAEAYWFNAICREFDDPFKPVLLRKS